MKTSLSLLTREGAVVVSFAAVLTPEQYARFYDRVREASTKEEMKACIEKVSRECGFQFWIGEPNEPEERDSRWILR